MTTDNPRDASILIVEDDRELADMYAAHLHEYDVEVAYGGQEALHLIDDRFDVVLLDRRMPVVSGNEVLASIRSEGLDCRVAMVTGATPDFDIVELQIDAYLVKPVSADELKKTVRRLLKLDTYNDRLQELSVKKLKRHVFQVENSESELERDPAFQQLNQEIQELEGEIAALAYELDEPDIESDVSRDTDVSSATRNGDARERSRPDEDAGRGTEIHRPAGSGNTDDGEHSRPHENDAERGTEIHRPGEDNVEHDTQSSSPGEDDASRPTGINRPGEDDASRPTGINRPGEDDASRPTGINRPGEDDAGRGTEIHRPDDTDAERDTQFSRPDEPAVERDIERSRREETDSDEEGTGRDDAEKERDDGNRESRDGY